MINRMFAQFSLLSFAIILLCAGTTALAQDERPGGDYGQQKGVVTDQNGKPLAGVEVSIGSETVKSDEKGEFVFRRLAPRVYTFNFKKEGYQPTSVRKEVAAIFNNRPIEVQMAPVGGQAAGQVDVQKLFQEATQMLQAGDFNSALQKFQALKVAAPGQAGVADAYIGLCFIQLGRYTDALEALKSAIAVMPDQPMVVTLIADAYLYTDQPGEALVYYEKLIELNIADAQTYLNMGIALHNQDQRDDAIIAFTKATELQADLADAWLRLGIALADGSRWAEAIPALEKNLELDPAGASEAVVKNVLAKACLEQAIALVNAERVADALPLLERVVSLAPESEEGAKAATLLSELKK